MAAIFDGLHSINIGTNLTDFQNISSGTMMCWLAEAVRTPVTGSGLIGLSLGILPLGADRLTIHIDPATGNFLFAGQALDGGVQVIANTGVAPAAGGWNHIAVVARYVANSWTLYVNGVSVFSAAAALGGVNTSNTPSLSGALMSDQSLTTEFLKGKMDDARFYNREVTANELLTIVSARGTDGIVSGLTSRWMLNELAPGNNVVGAVNMANGQRIVGVPAGTGSPVYTDSVLRGPRSKLTMAMAPR